MPVPEIPNRFLCPITHDVMFDPVLAEDGHTYERKAIERWFNEGHNTSPLGHGIIGNRLTPNRDLRAEILEFLDLNAHYIHEAIATLTTQNNQMPFIKGLIKRNRDNLNRKDDTGQTPLHIAVINRKTAVIEPDSNINIIQLLLREGANYKIRNNQHRTPKKEAKELGFWDIVEIIEQEIKSIDRMKLTEMRQQLEEISQAQIAQLQQENEQLRRELMGRVDNIHMLDITPLTTQYHELQRRTATLENEKATMQAHIAEVVESVTNLRTQHEDHRHEFKCWGDNTAGAWAGTLKTTSKPTLQVRGNLWPM